MGRVPRASRARARRGTRRVGRGRASLRPGRKVRRIPLDATVELVAPARKDVGSDAAEDLTARELEVLALVAQGLTDAEVAERLVVSIRTVHAHLRSIYRKLDVRSRSAATRYALEHGLASSPV